MTIEGRRVRLLMVYGESNHSNLQTAPHRAGLGLDSPLSPAGARGGDEVRTMAKRTDFQKAAVEVIDNKVHPDTRRCRADGTIEVKRSYFYRHGSTADGFAARVRDELTKAGLAAVVTGEDRWATWPRTSWFVAIVEDAARTEASIPEMRETIREMMDDFDRAKAGL